MKRIAVILTSYNRCTKTLNCLSKLYEQLLPVDYVLDAYLVIDGSTDQTEESVIDRFPQVHIIKGDGTLFWNRGMHLAWDVASKSDKYNFTLWLNDDTELILGALSLLIRIAESKSNKAIIVGATCSYKDEQLTTYGGRKNNRGYTLIDVNGEIQECETFNGNCVLIPQVYFTTLGNLDYYFRHSFGDIEYGLRATASDIAIFIAPKHIGYCERNEGVPAFLSPRLSLVKRLKSLYSPLGFNPLEAFYLSRKYQSLGFAIIRFIKIHLNSIFPTFFYKRR